MVLLANLNLWQTYRVFRNTTPTTSQQARSEWAGAGLVFSFFGTGTKNPNYVGTSMTLRHFQRFFFAPRSVTCGPKWIFHFVQRVEDRIWIIRKKGCRYEWMCTFQDGSKQFCYAMEFFHFSYLNRWKGHPNGNDDFMFDMLRHIQPMSWFLRTAWEKRSLIRLTRTVVPLQKFRRPRNERLTPGV